MDDYNGYNMDTEDYGTGLDFSNGDEMSFAEESMEIMMEWTQTDALDEMFGILSPLM